MFTQLQHLWNHRLFVSVALTETGSVHALRVRTVWLAFAVVFALSGWMGMMLAGDLAGARLTATLTGNSEMKYYLDMIAELRAQRDAEKEQVKIVAQELGVLQARLDRFDALSAKLKSEGTIASADIDDGTGTEENVAASSSRGKWGKGGPTLRTSPLSPSMDDVQKQVGLLNAKADDAELALETSMAMAIRKAVGTSAGTTIPYLWPVVTDGYHLSSPFGWRTDPVRGDRAWHAGMDIADSIGSPVTAAADGVVTYSGWKMGYGNCIDIKHSNGFSSRYGHLSKTIAREGQKVNAGDLIALMGNTGKSTGPHLHFEVRKDDNPLNPLPFIKDTRSEVMAEAKAGKGRALLSAWKNSGKVARK